jgi:hypothetical protein
MALNPHPGVTGGLGRIATKVGQQPCAGAVYAVA